MKKIFLFSLLVAALTSCGEEQNIKVGQKTTKVIASDKAKELIKKVND